MLTHKYLKIKPIIPKTKDYNGDELTTCNVSSVFFYKISRQMTSLHLVLSGREIQTQGQLVKKTAHRHCTSWPHIADCRPARCFCVMIF
jgi:hypothetical protein